MFIWKSLEYLYTLENGFKIEVIPFNFQNLQLNNRLLCTICFYTALKLISWFQYGIKKFRQIILSNLLLFVYKYIWAHKMGSKYINLLIGSIFLTFFCKKKLYHNKPWFCSPLWIIYLTFECISIQLHPQFCVSFRVTFAFYMAMTLNAILYQNQKDKNLPKM